MFEIKKESNKIYVYYKNIIIDTLICIYHDDYNILKNNIIISKQGKRYEYVEKNGALFRNRLDYDAKSTTSLIGYYNNDKFFENNYKVSGYIGNCDLCNSENVLILELGEDSWGMV